jgi:hypothetical protein
VVAHGDEVGRVALLVEVKTGLVDDAVALEIEVLDAELLDDVEHRPGVEQHRAEDRAFGLGVVRQPVGDGAGPADHVSWGRTAHGSAILPQKFVTVGSSIPPPRISTEEW